MGRDELVGPDELVSSQGFVAKYRHAILKAVAQVREHDMATILDRARERVANAANVIKLQLAPKSIEHDAAELRPDASRSAGAQSPGFKRRF
jgi:hypothetical protein